MWVSACEEPSGIDGIRLSANPENVLSCFVRWSTDQPMTSRVEFGEGASDQFVVQDPELTTDHELLVLGMRPERSYRLQAISETPGGEEARSPDMVFESGELPFESADIELVVHDEGRVQPGWTLTNLAVGLTVTPTVVVMLDMQGEVVWYHTLGAAVGRADLGVRLVPGDRVLIGGGVPATKRPVEVDLSGTVVWEGPLQPDGLAPQGGMHHDLRELPGGTYLALSFDYEDGHLMDVVEEFDSELETLWSWTTYDHRDVLGSGYPHGNMVGAEPDLSAVYYNARDAGLLYKIDYDSGDILWALGERGDFEMEGGHKYPWFEMQHDPAILEDGHVLVYDNGQLERGFSRVVEIEIDEQEMTARMVWEYPGHLTEDHWFKSHWGDADRLDNGNTLITAGSLLDGDEGPNRIFEVTPDGDVVWEIWETSRTTGEQAASYRADRIPALVGLL